MAYRTNFRRKRDLGQWTQSGGNEVTSRDKTAPSNGLRTKGRLVLVHPQLLTVCAPVKATCHKHHGGSAYVHLSSVR